MGARAEAIQIARAMTDLHIDTLKPKARDFE